MRWATVAMLMMGCTGGGILPCAEGAERGKDGVTCVGGGDTYVPIATGDTRTTFADDTAGDTGDTAETGTTDTASTDTSS
jgi:hypothetical protein